MDKKFTDRGWAAMEELLDKELPTDAPKEKRRPWIIFLLFFGIGLGIAISVVAGGLYFLDMKPQEVQKVVNQPVAVDENGAVFKEKETLSTSENTTTAIANEEQPTASIEETKPLPIDENIAKSRGNKAQKAGAKSTVLSTTKSSLKEKKQPLFAGNLTGNATEKVSENVNNSQKTEIRADGYILSNEQNIIVEKLNAQDAIIAGLNEPNKLIVNDLQIFDIEFDIPSLNLDLLELPDQNNDQTTKTKGRIGVEMGILGASNFAGISGGVVYGQPLVKQLSLQTGLNYSFQQRTFSGEPLGVVEVVAESEDSGGGTSTPNSYQEITDEIIQGNYENSFAQSDSTIFTIPQKLKFHYLNIPIKLNYQLTKKWSINGGMTGSLLLFATNTYTDGGLLNSNKSADFRTADVMIGLNTAETKVDKAILRNFDLAGNVGIAFHPSPKWSIAAQYHHGLVNFFKYSSEKKYNRFGQLSLQYYFGK